MDTTIWRVYSNIDNNQESLIEEFRTTPDVGILSWGYRDASSSLVSSFKEPSVFVPYWFNPSYLKDIPILMIPTAGFFGLDNSLWFRDSLKEYVNSGGVLVMMSQQHGYEYWTLPAKINGFGWLEDQGCFSASLYVDNWHQILSGQRLVNINALVDGYFTEYPDSTTILLRRKANGEPGMIMYSYGAGTVIATAMYEDWAYGAGQSTAQGRALMRDIISWAKKPEKLPQINIGQRLTVNVPIVNNTGNEASQIRFIVNDPDKNKVGEFTQGATLVPGQSMNVFFTPESSLLTIPGICWINYELLDASSNIIQGETEGERVALTVPLTGTKPNIDYMLWITTTTEYVTVGSTVVLTIHVKNNSDTDLIDGRLDVILLNDNGKNKTINDVDIKARTETEFTYSGRIDKSGTFFVNLLDVNNNVIAYGEKGILAVSPSAGVNLSLNKNTYKKDEIVEMTVKITNTTNLYNTTGIAAPTSFDIWTYITNPLNERVFSYIENINFADSNEVSKTYSYQLPSDAISGYGTYIVYTDLYIGWKKIGGNSTYFNVPDGLVSIFPTYPSVWQAGNNPVKFELANIGGEDIKNAKMTVELKRSFSGIGWGLEWNCYSDSTAFFDLGQGSTKLVDFNVNIAYDSLSCLFGGQYAGGSRNLEYKLNYNNKFSGGKEMIKCYAIVTTGLDKTKYNILDEIQLNVEVKNTGNFKMENGKVKVKVRFPYSGFEKDTTIISLSPANSIAINYSIPIPDETKYGTYDYDVSYEFFNERVNNSKQIIIPDYKLEINVPDGIFNTGNNLNISVKNTGGVPFFGKAEIYIRDMDGFNMTDKVPLLVLFDSTIGLLPERETGINFPISNETKSGNYSISVYCFDTTNKIISQAASNIEINGVDISFNVKSDKETYFTDDNINAISEFNLLRGTLQNAKLSYELIQEQGALQNYTGIGLNNCISIALDNGSVWFGLDGAGLVKYDGLAWTQYTVKDGLANNSVQCILIDNSGNKWFGTHNGLSRLSGMSWRTYNIEDGVAGNDITGIIQSKDGAIWVGTYEGGISKFEEGMWTTPSASNLQPLTCIWDICEDKNGVIWLGTNEGAFSYKNGIWRKYDTTNGLVSNKISCVYPDPEGNIWFGTWGEGIIKFDGYKFENFNVANGLSDLFIRDITSDKEGNIWAAAEYGLNKIEVRSQKPEVRKYFKKSGLGDDCVKSIAVDASGVLWAGTKKGISRFNGVNWAAYNTVPDKSGTSGHHIYSLLADSTTIWAGTESGLSKYDSGIWTNYSSQLSALSNQQITSITKDKDGYLWIGTWGSGLVKFNPENEQFNVYSRASLLSNYITSIGIAPDGSIWVGAWQGILTKYNNDGTISNYYGRSSGLIGESIWAIAFESTGTGWFGTDEGLMQFDGSAWKTYTTANGLPVNNISAITIDRTGVKWLGTWGGGVVKLDNGTFTTYGKADGLSSQYIWYIEIDDKDRVWCGTKEGGVCVFDNNVWQAINQTLPDNDIYSLSGLINQTAANWIGSYGGLISNLSPGNIILTKETTVDILYNNTNLTALLGSVRSPGKVYLKAKLKSSSGQLMSEDITSFYVLDKGKDLYVFLSSDKKGYKPGEQINLTGKITNLKDVDLSIVNLRISINDTDEIVYTDNFNLKANSSYSFNFNITAFKSFTLKVSASASPEVVIFEKIIVAEPECKAELIVPEIVGRNPFNTILKLENVGKIDINIKIQNSEDILPADAGTPNTGENIFLPVGKTAIITKTMTIDKDEEIVYTISGDINLKIKKQVKFGEKVNTIVTTQEEYEEGIIEIPYVLSNTGQIDSEVETEFRVISGQSQVISLMNKTHYVPVGQSLSGELQYNLTKGEYSLNYSVKPSASSLQSSAFIFDSGAVNFKVLKYNDMEINASANSNTSDGKINLSVNINNIGINDFTGTLLIESPFSRNQENITIGKGLGGIYNFLLTPVGLVPGQAEITVSILYSGKILLQKKISAEIYAPAFEFVSLPQSPVYRLGKQETMSFTVKNTGNLPGETEVKLKMLDILDNTQRIWLAPGEEGIVNFEFTFPDDLEAKEYKAIVQLGQKSSFEIPFKIEGIKINVEALLDKQNYRVGDIARLTLNVTNQDTTYMPAMFARVNYHKFDSTQNFVLTGGTPILLTFNIPVDEFNGEKVFYGIYNASGRSIWLNTIYLNKEKEIFNLAADKQVYKPGETALVTATSIYNGNLNYSAPGTSGEVQINGTTTFSITLPQIMTAGTYSINYTFSYQQSAISYQQSGTYQFDVDGIIVKILECNLDRGKYNTQDTIKTNLTIDASEEISGNIEAKIIDPEGGIFTYTNSYVNLTKGENKITIIGNFSTNVPGIHILKYRFYLNPSAILLTGWEEAFDAGNMVLAGLSSDKFDYPDGYETVYITANFYSQGNNTGNFKLTMNPSNSSLIVDEQVTLSGFKNKIYKVTPGETGEIKLTGELENGNLKSKKEVNFAYGNNLPDLVITNFVFNMPEEYGDTNAAITIGVKNIGKTTAGQFTVSMNNENINFGSLDANYESTIAYKLDVKGISSLQLRAIADSQNTIKEFHENNNYSQSINVIIPVPPQINPVSAYIRDTTIVISGNGTPGTQVVIYLIGRDVKSYVSVLVNQQGEFTASVNPVEGENTVWAKIEDNFGNISLYSEQVKFIRDTIPPLMPILTYPQDGTILYNQLVTIRGTAEPNCKIKMQIGNNLYITVADVNGEYIFSFITLAEGENIINIKAEDSAGNTSGGLSAKIIVKLVALEVKKEISNIPNVLVYTENKKIIQEIFESTEVNYFITETKEEFKNKLRTGLYNVYLMLSDNKEIGRIFEKEIKERIFGGEGAIASSEKINKEPKLQEVFGIKYKGYLPDKNNIINFTDTILSKQSTLETKGKAQKIKIVTAEMLGYISLTPDKIHNGKIKSISMEINYKFTENIQYTVIAQIYDGDKIKPDELIDEEKVIFTELPEEKIDNTNNKKVNLAINEIEEDKIQISIEDNKEEGKLQGEYTVQIIQKTEDRGQKTEKTIGPVTIKIDKCTAPKEGDIIGVFTIAEIEKEAKCCIEEKEPAAVINEYGEGKAIYFTIDLLKSFNTETKKQIKEIIINSIEQVAPEKIEPPESQGIITIGIDIENKGKTAELKVTEIAPENTAIVIPVTSNQTPVTSYEWQFKLIENGKKNLSYYLQTPDAIAVYTPITEIRYLDYDSSYRWYGKYLLDIQVNYDKVSLINEITNDLNALILIKEEQEKRKAIIKLLQKIQTEENKEKNVTDCLKSIDLLIKIKSTPVTLIRYKLIKLLKICERKE